MEERGCPGVHETSSALPTSVNSHRTRLCDAQGPTRHRDRDAHSPRSPSGTEASWRQAAATMRSRSTVNTVSKPTPSGSRHPQIRDPDTGRCHLLMVPSGDATGKNHPVRRARPADGRLATAIDVPRAAGRSLAGRVASFAEAWLARTCLRPRQLTPSTCSDPNTSS